MLQPSDVIAFLLIAAVIYFWWHLQGIRQVALRAGRAHCKTENVQLLDETVALARVRLKRGHQGRLQWSSRFTFEFTTTGADRYKGFIDLIGQRVELISLGAYRAH